jgi:predicted nucleic acid-binding protein
MTPDRVFADTNLFLRYLTNDVPAQADAVEALLVQAGRGEVILRERFEIGIYPSSKRSIR